MKNHWNASLPQNQRRTPCDLKELLLSNRFITSSDCWEWLGSRSKSGYGKIKWRPCGDLRVHRLAAMLWLKMDIGDIRLVCHRCDNPLCFNPAHLFIGTSKDNQIDCVIKGRNPNSNKTHCKHGHEYVPENTYVDSTGGRKCRACHRNNENARNNRRRVSQ